MSTAGRVRSLPRVIELYGRWGTVQRSQRGVVLKQMGHTGGYKIVTLWKDGVSKIYLVHRLVLEAFVGPRPVGHQVAHWDGDRGNNNLENLRWATPSDNQADRERHGTGRSGKKRATKQLDVETVSALRARYDSTQQSITELAKHFGLPRTTVADVINNRTWKSM